MIRELYSHLTNKPFVETDLMVARHCLEEELKFYKDSLTDPDFPLNTLSERAAIAMALMSILEKDEFNLEQEGAKDKSLEFLDASESVDDVPLEAFKVTYVSAVEDDDFEYREGYKITTPTQSLEFCDGEPEDATLSRDFSDVYKINMLIQEAYEAGRDGKHLEVTSKEVSSIYDL